jgi:hypothetical protein
MDDGHESTVRRDTDTRTQRTLRLTHGLYGLIIATAALVAEKEHVDKASEAIGLLLGTALILFLAHTYSEMVARSVIEARANRLTGLGSVARENLPLFFAVAIQTAFLFLAWVGVIALQAAYVASIAYTLVALVGLGAYAGRAASPRWQHAILAGVEAGAIGVIIVVLEVLFV